MLTRTRGVCYKKCPDQILNDIIVQMGVSFCKDMMVMIELSIKALLSRKDVDMYIYNL